MGHKGKGVTVTKEIRIIFEKAVSGKGPGGIAGANQSGLGRAGQTETKDI